MNRREFLGAASAAAIAPSFQAIAAEPQRPVKPFEIGLVIVPYSAPEEKIKVLRDLGQAFFGWQAPNGYPQLGAAWVNTGGMLSRWNTAFALAEGRIKGVRADLHSLTSPDLHTAGALVDALGAALLHAPLPAPARTALIEYASDGVGESATLDQAALGHRLPDLVGLILASPAFQTH